MKLSDDFIKDLSRIIQGATEIGVGEGEEDEPTILLQYALDAISTASLKEWLAFVNEKTPQVAYDELRARVFG